MDGQKATSLSKDFFRFIPFWGPPERFKFKFLNFQFFTCVH